MTNFRVRNALLLVAVQGLIFSAACANTGGLLGKATSLGRAAASAASDDKAEEKKKETGDNQAAQAQSSRSPSGKASASKGKPLDPDDELRAKGQTRADEILAMDKAAIGDVAAKKLFGRVNKVENLQDDPNSNLDWAAGAFTPIYVQENNAFKKRVAELLVEKYGGTERDVFDKTIPLVYCIEKARFERRLDDEAETKCKKSRYLGRQGWKYDDPVMTGILLEGVIHPLDEETQRNIRQAYVNTLGHERKLYKYETLDTIRKGISNKNTIYGVQLEQKPANEWTYRTVNYARDYAKRHNLDKGSIKALKKAMAKAERYQCRKLEGVYFIQDHEGGGRYGKTRAGSWGLRGAETIDCKKAKKTKKTGWAYKLLKKEEYQRVEKWLGAKASGEWRVERDKLGYPRRKIQEATIVWREEI